MMRWWDDEMHRTFLSVCLLFVWRCSLQSALARTAHFHTEMQMNPFGMLSFFGVGVVFWTRAKPTYLLVYLALGYRIASILCAPAGKSAPLRWIAGLPYHMDITVTGAPDRIENYGLIWITIRITIRLQADPIRLHFIRIRKNPVELYRLYIVYTGLSGLIRIEKSSSGWIISYISIIYYVSD